MKNEALVLSISTNAAKEKAIPSILPAFVNPLGLLSDGKATEAKVNLAIIRPKEAFLVLTSSQTTNEAKVFVF